MYLRQRRPGTRMMTALIIALVFALMTFSITVFAEGEGAAESAPFAYATALSLLPPVIAIVLALITKEVYSSLFIGVLVGSMLAASFSPAGTMDVMINDGLISAVSGSAGIFIFLVILGVLVALINKTGASAAFGEWAKTHIKTRTGAMLATFALGVLIFIDDYFNCLTVGSVMMPVTDTHKVSRAKLSYIIDATAAPVCMIAPISSWAAAVSKFAEGTGYSGIELFIRAIPYNFYSLLTLVFIIALAFMKFDYGPMAKHERNAIENGDLFTSGAEHDAVEDELGVGNGRGKVIDLIVPILVLIIICVIGLIYVGGFFDGVSFVDAFAETDATVGLPWGSMIALVVTIIYLIARRLITFKDAMACIPKGFIAMVPAILILTFATALKNTTNLLGADAFVEGLMKGAAEGLENFLPAVIFLVACFLSFSTGTSWGTFGILIPIVVAIFPADNELLYIGMSACLAGAVCGDHCSPISDTTIMSSAGARCDHLNHVSTQMPYALTVAAVSFVAYIVAGFVQSAWIALPIGIVMMIGTLVVIKMAAAKKN
ncbi:MAG: Na+/H+ antiporter NhaC family protein [Clostridia bacterium]|nr:Na+/H+ antiporter NhaC family protein [Clostridia bacterium]